MTGLTPQSVDMYIFIFVLVSLAALLYLQTVNRVKWDLIVAEQFVNARMYIRVHVE